MSYPDDMPTPAAALTLDKTSYNKGDKIIATYSVTGTDPSNVTVSGAVTVDGQAVAGIGSVSLQILHPTTFAAPTAPGLTFVATADPRIWTATA